MAESTCENKMAKFNRFGKENEDDIEQKKLLCTPKNTLKCNDKAARALKDYLAEQGEDDTKFEQFSNEKLNKVLSRFYVNARTVHGNYYKASSLINIRHSLNRYLNGPPISRDIDLIKDPAFKGANEAYKAAQKELKTMGKGSIEHYPSIVDSDLKKIGRSFDTTTPVGLIDKVQFDIRLYFCRRGMQNMHAMTKNTFAVRLDANTNTRYVLKQVDELEKNHQSTGEAEYTAFMPECPDPQLCPVASFEKLLSVSNFLSLYRLSF